MAINIDYSSTPSASTSVIMTPVASTSSLHAAPLSSPDTPSSSCSDTQSSSGTPTSFYAATSSSSTSLCMDMDDDAFSFGTLPQMDAESTEWDPSVFEEAVDSFVKQMETTPSSASLMMPLDTMTSTSIMSPSSATWEAWTTWPTPIDGIPGLSPTRSDSTLSEEDIDEVLMEGLKDFSDEESIQLLAQFVESCQSPSGQEAGKLDFDLDSLLASSSPLSWSPSHTVTPDAFPIKQELAGLTPTASTSN